MSTDIDAIKRKLLIKYPTFGSVLANLEFQASSEIGTAGTDGEVVYYNSDFLKNLSEKQQTFIFAHELCHVAFKHIFRSEGKDKRLWNIATDSVINALLKQDGLPIVEGGVDIEGAENYDAEQMYNKLLEDEKKNQEQQESQGNQGEQDSQENQKQQGPQGGQGEQDSQENQEQQGSQGGQGEQDSQENQEQQESQGSQGSQEENDIGHDTHSLWDKAIEKRKQIQAGKNRQEEQEQDQEGESEKGEQEQEQAGENGQGEQEQDTVGEDEQGNQEGEDEKEQEKQAKNKEKNEKEEERKQEEKNEKEETKEQKEKKKDEEESEFVKKGEKETFKQNKIERKKQLQELSKELANMSSHKAGNEIQREGKKLSDIGIAAPLIDWRRLLRQAIKYNEEYTRKNARMRNDYFRHKLIQIPIPESEIVLDTSGSVSEVLLKNFLRECKNIINNSKVKVGCFNTEFHGFTELKKPEDIDNMSFPIGGGTDFNAAVEAFSKKAQNKIIFTDGEADMPQKAVRNVIWIVFGNEKINPKGGKVINITGEQLERLYKSSMKYKDDISR